MGVVGLLTLASVLSTALGLLAGVWLATGAQGRREAEVERWCRDNWHVLGAQWLDTLAAAPSRDGKEADWRTERGRRAARVWTHRRRALRRLTANGKGGRRA